jgi:diketogulonate reductase-like aldo/keto reductase
MAVNVFLNLPGGLKMPSLGLGTWEVSFKYFKFIEIKKIS